MNKKREYKNIMKIGIIGGGITGLSGAYKLLKKEDIEVTIFEKEDNLGGLASSFYHSGFYLEKYYHHVFKCDTEIIKLINELGLKGDFIWRETKMGFFYEGNIYPFGTPLELLLFKPLSIINRIRFGLTIFYLQKLNNWDSLEKITAEEFLIKWTGEKTYEVLWKPLLKIKFGSFFDKVSASFIWGRVKPRAKSRSRGGLTEELGYMKKGGFKTFINSLEDEIKKTRGKILKKSDVRKMEIMKDGKVKIFYINDSYREEIKELVFDKVIFTIPNPIFLKILKNSSIETAKNNYFGKLRKIKYQSIVCSKLLLKEPLSNFYWLNVSDENISFGGVIEHTNFIDKNNYGNNNVLYLFNYVQKDDKIFNLSDKELMEIYIKDLKKIFPAFDEKLVNDVIIDRDLYGTPIYETNYSDLLPSFKTPIKNVYLANTSQIYPFDRNMNNSVKLGNEIAGKVLK